MASRPVVLNLPGELLDALGEVASRYGTSTGSLAEQALVQFLLQQSHRAGGLPGATGDDLEALIRA